ncbi:MAG: DMT family transporter [Candidatus Zixiibacteriota bacterium]|nr:MAG: DMT family transporter [candidate division Zixibacteria bacterium]
MKSGRAGDLYALVCAVVCGFGNILLKLGLVDISTELFNFYFFVFAFLISLTMLFSRRSRKDIIHTRAWVFGLIALLSVLFSLGIYTFFWALRLIEPATVSFLSRFEVIITIVLAYVVLKERLHSAEILGGVIAVAGVLVLKFKTTLIISEAATLMILSSFFFGTAEILVKKFIHQLGIVRFVFYRNLFAIGLFYLLLRMQGQQMYLPPMKTLILAAAAALMLPILGRATFMKALKHINISRAALITQAIPLFTAFFALVVLRSLPTLIEWFGGGLIIAGVVIVKLSERILTNRKGRLTGVR